MGDDSTVPRNKIEIVGEMHTKAGGLLTIVGSDLTMPGSDLNSVGSDSDLPFCSA